MRIARISMSIGVFALWTAAFTLPAFIKDVKSTYGIKPGSKIGKSACALCHLAKQTKLNAYGLDLRKAIKQENAKVLTGSVLKKVEGLDSDKDGVTNIDEIRGDTLPGDPNSK